MNLGGTTITDAGLEHLKGLTQLRGWIFGTKSQTGGLEHLKGLTQLGELDIADTKVTDAGLAQLKGLTHLGELNLAGTRITDAGLEHLKGLARIRRWHFDGTGVTEAGLESLKRAMSTPGSFCQPTNKQIVAEVANQEQIADEVAGLLGITQSDDTAPGCPVWLVDLNHTPVTDAWLKHLKGLKQLR